MDKQEIKPATRRTSRVLDWIAAITLALASITAVYRHTTIVDKHGAPMHPVNMLTANCTNKRGDIVLGCVGKQVKTVWGAVVDNAGGITISHTTGDMDMATHPIHSLGSATALTDAVNQAGLNAAGRPAMDLACLANVAALTGTTAVCDTVTVSAGNRVLLTAQSTQTQNGPWVVASGSWARPLDFSTGQHAYGAGFRVIQGSAKANTTWHVTTTAPNDAIDTNNLTITQVTGPGALTFSQLGQATTNVTFGDGTKTFGGVGDPSAAQDALTLNYSRLLRSPNWTVEWQEDFTGCSSVSYTTNNYITGGASYLAVSNGTGAIVACNGSGVYKFGAVQIYTGSAGTNYAGVQRAPTTGTYGLQQYVETATELYWEARLQVMALPNGTDNYTGNIGFSDAYVPVAAPTNYIGFRWTNGNTNYQFVNTAASQSIDTGVAVEVTNLHRFEITKAFGTDTVIGKIDGADVTTATGPIASHPTVAMQDAITAVNSAGTGTTRKFNVDFIHYRNRWPTGSPRGN